MCDDMLDNFPEFEEDVQTLLNENGNKNQQTTVWLNDWPSLIEYAKSYKRDNYDNSNNTMTTTLFELLMWLGVLSF